jgi:hypothetical protein
VSLAAISTLGGFTVRVEGSGRPEGSPACGLVMRPTLVEARRALAALIWQGREQKTLTFPLRGAGGNSVEHWRHAGNGVILLDRERAPGVVTKSP